MKGAKALAPYSVLLRFPTYCTDGAYEDAWCWVRAESPKAAVAKARRRVARAHADVERGSDLEPALVLAGHHYGLDPESETGL